MNELDEKICAIAERAFPELFSLACDIYDHPETGLQEYYASGRLVSFLREKGFSVETGTGGLETAFRATLIKIFVLFLFSIYELHHHEQSG